ncbi:hypothetical protein EVAR_57246_1 [Eumeta japonica]|uniref:Uncharacterized protein n=1 Tax=Eumeta variegata TaxID=151549 RepID=A0A4C1YN44_EUMVA|nr:hypothetical protein EVAR_57246_1 [Eumeta japonica]
MEKRVGYQKIVNDFSDEFCDGHPSIAVNDKNQCCTQYDRKRQACDLPLDLCILRHRFQEGVLNSLWDIVTGGEIWIYCNDPKTKQQPTVWVYRDELKPTKVGRKRSTCKRIIAFILIKLDTWLLSHHEQ